MFTPLIFLVSLTINCGGNRLQSKDRVIDSADLSSPKPVPTLKQKIDSGEKQEEREFNPPSSKNAPIKYIYEWVVDIDGTIPTRRVHFDKPFSLAVAKQIAEEMLPTAERGKFRKAAIGDIGYPGDIGRIETYENYEVIYRLNKQNQVSAVKIYAH